VISEREPPRELEDVVEHVFAFAELRVSTFTRACLPSRPSQHADDQRQPRAGEQVAGSEEHRHDRRHRGSEERDVHRRDARAAQAPNDPGLERSVRDGREVEGAVLRRIQQ
jgi:hypothetical protein